MREWDRGRWERAGDRDSDRRREMVVFAEIPHSSKNSCIIKRTHPFNAALSRSLGVRGAAGEESREQNSLPGLKFEGLS